jgi:hypothetical protein
MRRKKQTNPGGVEFNWRALAGELYKASICGQAIGQPPKPCEICNRARRKYLQAIAVEES